MCIREVKQNDFVISDLDMKVSVSAGGRYKAPSSFDVPLCDEVLDPRVEVGGSREYSLWAGFNVIEVALRHRVEGVIAFSIALGKVGIEISSSSSTGIVDRTDLSSILISSSSLLEWDGDEVHEGNGAAGVGLVTVAS